MLIPEISLTDFRKLKASQIQKLKCCEVTSDGEYLFTVIVPQTAYVRSQAENIGQLSNAVGGEDIDGILNKQEAP